MSKWLKGLSIVSSFAVLAAILIIAGCSQNLSLEPNSPQTLSLNKDLALSGSSSDPLSSTVSAEKDISADLGGTIVIDRDGYRHEFTVQALSISGDTHFTVVSSKDRIGLKEAVVFEFGPDGLVFSTPADLIFEIAELNAKASSAKLYYYDPGTGKWVYQGSSLIDGSGKAVFPISHFSKYAISD